MSYLQLKIFIFSIKGGNPNLLSRQKEWHATDFISFSDRLYDEINIQSKLHNTIH